MLRNPPPTPNFCKFLHFLGRIIVFYHEVLPRDTLKLPHLQISVMLRKCYQLTSDTIAKTMKREFSRNMKLLVNNVGTRSKGLKCFFLFVFFNHYTARPWTVPCTKIKCENSSLVPTKGWEYRIVACLLCDPRVHEQFTLKVYTLMSKGHW